MQKEEKNTKAGDGLLTDRKLFPTGHYMLNLKEILKGGRGGGTKKLTSF